MFNSAFSHTHTHNYLHTEHFAQIFILPNEVTEFEEGFQDWGETPEHPNDYFWGRTAAAATREALRWFARG
jgi:hypothetical protein